MVTEQNTALAAQNSVPLKLDEPQADAENPWGDDLLGRQRIATRLTNLIATQKPPLTISLHGQWGTGKTFVLTRWQKALVRKNYQAIYFNAWEDDFSDDPLLAIIGQLADYFSEGNLKETLQKATQSIIPLLLSNASSLLNQFTGLTTEFDHNSPTKGDLLKEYRHQRTTKDQLKGNLQRLAAEVYDDSKHPLVFIIDELDRCRPTFAIELLERVKHIFDVPNMVFVFGLNHDELCNSLASVYGNIETDVYLRRFFDFEFNLPESDSQVFALHLIDTFKIGDAFKQLGDVSGSRVHMADYNNFRRVFPELWNALGLSLRDIRYGIQLLALLTSNVPAGMFTHPYLLAVLIGIKFTNPDFYHKLVGGNFQASEIMDFIDGIVQRNSLTGSVTAHLDRIEGFLYCADNTNRDDQMSGENAYTELIRLRQGDVESGFQVISKRAQVAEPEQISRIIRGIEASHELDVTNKTFANLAPFIDVYQAQLRR